MTLFSRFLCILSLVMVSISAFAQTPSGDNDPVYGYDPLLYNGRVYTFYAQPGTEGTQYLFDSFDKAGSITVRGVTYTNITLNFDIYNQLLIMKYKNTIGSTSLIEISFGWLEQASMWGCDFEFFAEANSTKRLYQVIGSGNEKIMYYRSKELLIDNLKSSKNHYFSSGKKEMYVKSGGLLTPFRNNASFVKSFGVSNQSLIKSYLHTHKINVKTASDIVMADLITYCNSLSGS